MALTLSTVNLTPVEENADEAGQWEWTGLVLLIWLN